MKLCLLGVADNRLGGNPVDGVAELYRPDVVVDP
jgi:hypothetical protein